MTIKNRLSHFAHRCTAGVFGVAMAGVLAVANAPAAHAGTPLREIAARPYDFASAIYSVFSSWQFSEAFRGAGVSPWSLACSVIRYAYIWNPVSVWIGAALAAVGLGYLLYRMWPSIQNALRARGFST